MRHCAGGRNRPLCSVVAMRQLRTLAVTAGASCYNLCRSGSAAVRPIQQRRLKFAEGPMTLIAQLSVNGAPILIGDVLLSRETRTGLKVNLPLVGNINKILAANGLPFEVEFAQKINVFDGRIAVAWSGPSIQAKTASGVLACIASKPNLTVPNIDGELKAIDRAKIDQLQLIGLLLEEVSGTTVKGSFFSHRVPREDIPNFGQGYVAESGRSAFLQMLQKGDFLAQTNANEYDVAHGLLAVLTNEEYRTGNTIADRWGGGFEALTSRSGRLEKVGDILHTLWEVNSDGSIGLFPSFFYKTTYWRDALVLRTASFESFQDNELRLKTNEIKLIPPLLKEINEYDLAELGSVDFSYRALCCHVRLNKPSNRVMFFIEERESGQDALLRLDVPGELHISKHLKDKIKDAVEHQVMRY
jgi:hypothetical protein